MPGQRTGARASFKSPWGVREVTKARHSGKVLFVNIQEIKSELQALPADERRELVAFLVSLRHKDLAGYRARMSEKIDGKNPESWVTLEELDQRLKSRSRVISQLLIGSMMRTAM